MLSAADTIPLIALGVRTSMEYNTLMITGQKIFRNDSLTFGQAYDQNMQPIYEVQCPSHALYHLQKGVGLAATAPSLSQVTANGLANFTVLEDGTQRNNFTQSSSPDFTSLLPVSAKTFLRKFHTYGQYTSGWAC